MSPNETVKIQNISKIQEIILNKEPSLIDDYLDSIMQFALDRNAEVRKSIAAFIEDAG